MILILLALGGLSYYVSTIDWNNYKTKMTAQLEKITGKKIVINGKIDLTFWPKPHLSATNIKVYNSNPNPAVANTPIAEVKEMVADLSLMPLIKKQFVIDKMNLVNANLLIEFLDDGKTNWYSPIDAEQSFNLAGVDIAFNSVMLQDSVVRIVNKTLNVDSAFHKVNADIAAQSLIGPFRIDGNFLKDNTPAGFALNVGTLSESFSTSLNLVLTHPSSESYARFDGSVLSNNSEIKGNFTVESQKPSVFVNTITGQKLLDEKYNYPVAASIDLSVNPRQADLSSFIVKYGDNLAGSGRVLVPLVSTNDEPKKIEAVFEMTDLDLMPFVSVLQEYLKQAEASKKPYEPAFTYDLAADVAATRALLGGETIRNFKLSADIVKGVIKIKNLAALTAGDTDISVKGDIFENDKRLMYNFQVQALSQDLLKFLHWANVNVEAYTPSTYRSARASFNLSGTLSEIKIAPVELGFDKVEMSGVIGIKRDRKNAIFLNLQSENINFDNYLPEPKKDADKETFTTRAKQFLSQFKFLNTTDLEANLSLSLGIYHKIPFENTTLKLSARDGVVTLKEMSIANVASSKLSATGVLSKLNGNPSFENLKYKFDISDFKTFNQKLKLGLPDWPLFHQTQKATLEGIASGTFDAFNTKTIAQVGKTAVSYAGRLSNNDGQLFYRGKLKLKAPDFVEFANQIGLD
ncbi:MAG: AsmA family protein, partial [Alphaproteobacteria bacterium]|nr:AsmA family protein [Alphaproteobacteria bacterium]